MIRESIRCGAKFLEIQSIVSEMVKKKERLRSYFNGFRIFEILSKFPNLGAVHKRRYAK